MPPPPPPICLPFAPKRVRWSATGDASSHPQNKYTSAANELTFDSHPEDEYSSAATIHSDSESYDSLPESNPKLARSDKQSNTATGAKKKTLTGKWGDGWGFVKKDQTKKPSKLPTPETSSKPGYHGGIGKTADPLPPDPALPRYLPPNSTQASRTPSQDNNNSQRSHSDSKSSPALYASDSTSTLIGSAYERKVNAVDPPLVAFDMPGRQIIRKHRRPSLPDASSSTLVGSAYERKINDVEVIKEKPGTSNRLQQIRNYMLEGNLDYYIVPSENAHLSEYVAPSDKRREFISGFTGSSGTAVITSAKAYLVVDVKDCFQVNEQVDENWTVVKTGSTYGHRDWIDWLVDRCKNSRIGLDARMISYEKGTFLNSKVLASNAKLVFPPQNLVDLVWKDKPPKLKEKVYKQPIEFAAAEASYKIHKLRQWIKKYPPPGPSQIHAGTLVTSLPCVAFMLNMRGSDIPFNSLFYAYLFVGLESTILFVDANKVQDDMTEYLSSINVQRRDYNDVWPFLQKREWGQGKLLILPQTSYVISLILTHTRMTLAPSYVEYIMSIINEAEIQGLKRAQVRDKASYTRWIDWLELNLMDGTSESSETAQYLRVPTKPEPARTNDTLKPKISNNLEAQKSSPSRPSSSSKVKRTESDQRGEHDIPVQAATGVVEMQERPEFRLAILALLRRIQESAEAVG